MRHDDKHSIGGYLSLEVPTNLERYSQSLCVNTGRNALIKLLQDGGYQRVRLPEYFCPGTAYSINEAGFDVLYYEVDRRLKIGDVKEVWKGSAFVAVNYFGVLDDYILELCDNFSEGVIVDCTQAFYFRPDKGAAWFNSCRKFFGVPDGAYLSQDRGLGATLKRQESHDISQHLLTRADLGPEEGYEQYKRNNSILASMPVRKVSRLSERILRGIDYSHVASRRRANFAYLHSELSDYNQLDFNLLESSVPLVYPLMTDNTDLRKKLIAERVYVATYWPGLDEMVGGSSLAHQLATNIVPLPIDQRYDEADLSRVAHLVTTFL